MGQNIKPSKLGTCLKPTCDKNPRSKIREPLTDRGQVLGLTVISKNK